MEGLSQVPSVCLPGLYDSCNGRLAQSSCSVPCVCGLYGTLSLNQHLGCLFKGDGVVSQWRSSFAVHGGDWISRPPLKHRECVFHEGCPHGVFYVPRGPGFPDIRHTSSS